MGATRYPKDAKEAGIQGAVYGRSVVKKDGSNDAVCVLYGIGGDCGKEAVRVGMAMSELEPGSQRGKPVRVQLNLPIRYTLRNPTWET